MSERTWKYWIGCNSFYHDGSFQNQVFRLKPYAGAVRWWRVRCWWILVRAVRQSCLSDYPTCRTIGSNCPSGPGPFWSAGHLGRERLMQGQLTSGRSGQCKIWSLTIKLENRGGYIRLVCQSKPTSSFILKGQILWLQKNIATGETSQVITSLTIITIIITIITRKHSFLDNFHH